MCHNRLSMLTRNIPLAVLDLESWYPRQLSGVFDSVGVQLGSICSWAQSLVRICCSNAGTLYSR